MNKQPRYVKLYGNVELSKAVKARLFELGYRWSESSIPGCPMREIGIDCERVGELRNLDQIVGESHYYTDEYNAIELPLSELFDGTFPAYVEEKPKPTKMRVWREGARFDPDVVWVLLSVGLTGVYLEAVDHNRGSLYNGKILYVTPKGITRLIATPKDFGIVVDDDGRVEDITEGVE